MKNNGMVRIYFSLLVACGVLVSGCGRDKYPQFSGDYTLQSSTPTPTGMAWPERIAVLQSSRSQGMVYNHTLQIVVPNETAQEISKTFTYDLGLAQHHATATGHAEAWDGDGLDILSTDANFVPSSGQGACRIIRYYRLTVETQPSVQQMNAVYEWTEQLRDGRVVRRTQVHINDDALDLWNEAVDRQGGVIIKQRLLRHSISVTTSCGSQPGVRLEPEADLETEAVYFSNARLGDLPPDDAIGRPSTAGMFQPNNSSAARFFLPLLENL